MQLPDNSPEIRADERRLQQVIANLLSNAIKFTGAGGAVVLSATCDESGALAIQVTDTGIGIAPNDLDRVFEPFIQLDESLTRRFQGAGLGLYVSRALIEAQGGKLTLSSKPGRRHRRRDKDPSAKRQSGYGRPPAGEPMSPLTITDELFFGRADLRMERSEAERMLDSGTCRKRRRRTVPRVPRKRNRGRWKMEEYAAPGSTPPLVSVCARSRAKRPAMPMPPKYRRRR